MRSRGSSCALTALLLLAGAGFFSLASTAPAQNTAFRGGLTTTTHNLVDLIDMATVDGRSRSDIKHLHNALNQLLHVLEKNGHGKKGSMGKGLTNANSSPSNYGSGRQINAAANAAAFTGANLVNNDINALVNVNATNNARNFTNARNLAPASNFAGNVAVNNKANGGNAKNGGAANVGNGANNKAGNRANVGNAAVGLNNNFANNAGNNRLVNNAANNAGVNVKANAKNLGPANNVAKNAVNNTGNNKAANHGNAKNNASCSQGGVRVSVKVNVAVGASPGSKARASASANVNVNRAGNAKNGPANNVAVRNAGLNNSSNVNAGNLGNAKNAVGPAVNNLRAKNAAGNNAPTNNLAKNFPNLGNHKVLDASNKKYNCISHTLGVNNQWINPKTGPANAPLAPMDKLYAANGFQRQNNLDLRPDPKNQKVALYATKKPDGSINKVTHAALQQPNGTWTSKLGGLPLVQHSSPYSVAGSTYGAPVAAYSRPVAGNSVGQRPMNNLAANRKR